MRVLTVYAHHNPRSFCHAVLERFTEGLRDAGHASEVVDLHAIGFDPVLRDHDTPDWIDDSVPDDVLEHMQVRRSLTEASRNPIRRLMVRRWIGDRDDREIVRRLHALGAPRDVAEQQAKVARADALAFIAPVYFVGFPAILKGWIERVFSLGFAFGMTADAWRGDIAGRIPLLTHEKALIIQTTIWNEASYDAGLKAAMKALIDEYALRYPGIKRVEHEYFHALHGADDAMRRSYLDRAYLLGREF
jgi:NAD(P)H dehydrogenase (quinone)